MESAPMDDVVCRAEQTLLIEAARAHVADMGPLDMTDVGQLAGHLMVAEVLLMEIAEAFTEPASA
jgi:hypothetical protein